MRVHNLQYTVARVRRRSEVGASAVAVRAGNVPDQANAMGPQSHETGTGDPQSKQKNKKKPRIWSE
jgi:hypothetical protein